MPAKLARPCNSSRKVAFCSGSRGFEKLQGREIIRGIFLQAVGLTLEPLAHGREKWGESQSKVHGDRKTEVHTGLQRAFQGQSQGLVPRLPPPARVPGLPAHPLLHICHCALTVRLSASPIEGWWLVPHYPALLSPPPSVLHAHHAVSGPPCFVLATLSLGSWSLALGSLSPVCTA